MDYNILRENDIRGEYPNQVNQEVAYRIGKAFGTYLTRKGVNTCVIGHDNRLSNQELHDHLIKGILNTGINVIDIGLSTTPLFNYSCIVAQIPYGIMITASHNKASDNGFKIFGENYLHLEADELEELYDLIKSEEYILGEGTITQASYLNEYIKMLGNKVNIIKPIKVVFDPGNGTTSILVKEVFSQFNLDATYIFCESDGSFPVHNPDPNDLNNLKWLKDKVLELGADIGIGFDGDGDRIGIVDEKGNMVATDILMGIFAGDIIPRYHNNNKIVYDVKCSKALDIELRRINADPVMLKNGSAYIETQVYKRGALFGGEYSGHVFFRDDFYGFDDGVYAGIRIIELLSRTEKKCSSLYEHFEHFYNTPEIRITVDDNLKRSIVEQVKEYALSKNYNVSTIDGVRVDYDDGFSLIRCSNTGPTITLRFEAKSEEVLELRKREFLNLVEYFTK